VTAIAALPAQQAALADAIYDDVVAEIVGDAASQTALAGALANDLLSKDGGNAAVLGTDSLIYVAPGAAPVIVSADAGNTIVVGSDGGAHLAVATTLVAGAMSAADKTKLDALPVDAVSSTRAVNTGAGLQGGGDLSADRTIIVAANGIDNTMLADMGANTIKGAVGRGRPGRPDPGPGVDHGHVGGRRQRHRCGYGRQALRRSRRYPDHRVEGRGQ
jgi:hypothetical protein